MPAAGALVADRYRIERLIGAGGMGNVFLARHELVGQPVALKLLNERAASDKDAVKRFFKEARAAAKIRGEHVARILDVGQLPNGQPYISMEYLQGEDLARRLERVGALPATDACGHVLDAIHALAQAHAMGIVHRDLKPSNLFLAEQPAGPPVLKVLDFGIAKMEEAGSGGGATSTGTIMGTPAYMAPEQMRSSRSVDPRADVWALGVIAYELIAGRVPFAGDSLGDVLIAVIERKPVPLHQLAPDVPLALGDVIMKCLQRDPDQRFADVAALAEALVPFAGPEHEADGMIIRTVLRASQLPTADLSESQPVLEAMGLAPTEPAKASDASDGSDAAENAMARPETIGGQTTNQLSPARRDGARSRWTLIGSLGGLAAVGAVMFTLRTPRTEGPATIGGAVTATGAPSAVVSSAPSFVQTPIDPGVAAAAALSDADAAASAPPPALSGRPVVHGSNGAETTPKLRPHDGTKPAKPTTPAPGNSGYVSDPHSFGGPN